VSATPDTTFHNSLQAIRRSSALCVVQFHIRAAAPSPPAFSAPSAPAFPALHPSFPSPASLLWYNNKTVLALLWEGNRECESRNPMRQRDLAGTGIRLLPLSSASTSAILRLAK